MNLAPKQYEEIKANSTLDMQVCAAYRFAGNKKSCGQTKRRFICLREEGHDGPHVAHCDEQSAAAWWPNEEGQ